VPEVRRKQLEWASGMLGEAMVNAQQEFSISLQQHFRVAVSRRDFVGRAATAAAGWQSGHQFPMKMFR
jgi:hypothetical protein